MSDLMKLSNVHNKSTVYSLELENWSFRKHSPPNKRHTQIKYFSIFALNIHASYLFKCQSQLQQMTFLIFFIFIFQGK